MLNRTQAPDFSTISSIPLIQPQKQVSNNGLPLFVIEAGTAPLVKIEWLFSHAPWQSDKPLLSAACNTLLNEGTSKHTAAEIADYVDFYGAFLQTESSFDQSTVTLYCLNKNMAKVLPLVKEILTDSIFSEQELKTYRRNQQEKLALNHKKNDFVARKSLNQLLFGEQSIYGYQTVAADYDRLQREDLLAYFQSVYSASNCTMIASGKVDAALVALLQEHFGSKDWQGGSLSKNQETLLPSSEKQQLVFREEALQSAIRIGKPFIAKDHPDYAATRVLNTALGGYFGSRLMSNIREDKGYTYGIGSNIVSMQHGSYFYIATEVGAEVCGKAVEEIYKEIDRLQQEPIPAAELDLVRNYMLGSFLGDLENAFSYADKFKGVYFNGLDYDYYDQLIETIKTVSPHKLQDLAQTHLKQIDLYEVVVGRK